MGEYVALRSAGAGAQKRPVPVPRREDALVHRAREPRHLPLLRLRRARRRDRVPAEDRGHRVRRGRRAVADRVGVQLAYEGGGMGHQRDRGTKTRLLEANKRAAEFYAAQLRTPEAAPAMAFLTARGFDAVAAERFGCGYAPAGWDALTKHLLSGGILLRGTGEGRALPSGQPGPDGPLPPSPAVADPRPRRRGRRVRGAAPL